MIPPSIEITNRTLWYSVAAMLAVYLIWVLEDLVRATKKPTIVIFEKEDNVIEGNFIRITGERGNGINNEEGEAIHIPPLKSAKNSENLREEENAEADSI